MHRHGLLIDALLIEALLIDEGRMATRNRKLSTYRARRDFSRTSEPGGERTVRKSQQLRFGKTVNRSTKKPAASGPAVVMGVSISSPDKPLWPRVREGAPISVPIAWTQVKSGLDPSRYTLRTALPLIRRSTAWEGYDDDARPLMPAIREVMASGRSERSRTNGKRSVRAEHRRSTPAPG